MPQPRWTDDQTEKLVALHLQGLEYKDIAARLGITVNAVCGKSMRLRDEGRLPPRRVKTEKPVTNFLPPIPRFRGPIPDRGSCCWPIGDPKHPDFRFCSEPALPGRPYCELHDSVARPAVKSDQEQLVA